VVQTGFECCRRNLLNYRRRGWNGSEQNNVTRSHTSEFVRFIFFGAVNTGITFVMYVFLLWFLSYGIAYTISYAAGILISYWLNAMFVFQEPLRIGRALQYPLVYLLQYLLGLVLLFLLVEVAHVSKIVALLLIVVLTLPITFLLSRYLIRRSFGLSQRGRTGSMHEK
jgi:putative flippase GtrA